MVSRVGVFVWSERTKMIFSDLQKGIIAFNNGGYATALREWMPLAEQGNADAQASLGIMYAFGNGVIKDNVYAHMWGNIAASPANIEAEIDGALEAVEYINLIEDEMTPSQIAEAQKLARECVRKKYKGC